MKSYDKKYWDIIYEDEWDENIYMLAKILLDFQPQSIFEIGCSFGKKLEILLRLNPILKVYGIDISEYAINKASNFIKPYIEFKNILDVNYHTSVFELVMAFEILEHLEVKDIEYLLSNLNCDRMIASFPTIETTWKENFYLDPTHVIYESRTWWKELFSKYFGTVEFNLDDYREGGLWILSK
jgi:2-polyprenyl-3-methyl-5-hydroxy-6-metoxy-1,4-benzoquinol methylase